MSHQQRPKVFGDALLREQLHATTIEPSETRLHMHRVFVFLDAQHLIEAVLARVFVIGERNAFGLEHAAQSHTASGPKSRSQPATASAAPNSPSPWRKRPMKGSRPSECVRFKPPLPASKNLRPADGMASNTATATPARDNTSAAIKPAGPAPRMATSGVSIAGAEVTGTARQVESRRLCRPRVPGARGDTGRPWNKTTTAAVYAHVPGSLHRPARANPGWRARRKAGDTGLVNPQDPGVCT